ncbi:MAG: DUF3499 domain-containing protein [Corynebacterium sp.]|nr:DUF3499 domain-containing protein [Corynebacterium sp.]
MTEIRRCSRPGCNRPAVATLTYAYSEQTAVVGPLAEEHDPHSWDLCSEHADRITAPQGWELVRVDQVDLFDDDELLALAAAVREAGRVTTGLVDGDGAGSGADPIDYAANFDGADPRSSNHPVFRTRRVADIKQRRRAHLTVVPDISPDSKPEGDNGSVRSTPADCSDGESDSATPNATDS